MTTSQAKYTMQHMNVEERKKFIERVLCEARGTRYGRVVYWRFDLKRPIQFQDQGTVPVTEILSCLRTLSITVEKYLSTLDDLFPLGQ